MQKLLIVMPRSPREDFAGIENSAINIARHALKHMDVEVIATAKKPMDKVEFQGVPIHEYTGWAPAEAYYFSLPLYRRIRASDADIIHCNGYNNLTTLLGMIAKQKHQRLVVTLNSSGSSSAFRRALRRPYAYLFNLFAHKVDAFIAVSPFEKEHFDKIIPGAAERIHFIPNGVDELFFGAGKKWHARKPTVLFVGRLVENKGAAHAIRGFAHAFKKEPKAQMIIIGKGEQETLLRALVQEMGLEKSIQFSGEIPGTQREKMAALMGESRVFILPSQYESQGIVVSEAIAAGMNTIVCENSALSAFIQEGNALAIGDRDDARAIGELIVRALEKQHRPKKSLLVVPWEEVAARTMALYRQLLD